MSGADRSRGTVRPVVALAFATTAFVALVVFSLGMLSLLLDEDVVATPGIGQVPGVAGVAASALVFAGSLWSAIRPARGGDGRHPSFWNAPWIALASALAHVAALWLAAVATGADPAAAAAIAGRIVTSWFGAAIALCALVCAWGGIALARTHARRPRWPWESGDEP